MGSTIQRPFMDVATLTGKPDPWSDEETALLLCGVAAGDSWQQISNDISDELADRSPKACEMQFHRIRVKVRKFTRSSFNGIGR